MNVGDRFVLSRPDQPRQFWVILLSRDDPGRRWWVSWGWLDAQVPPHPAEANLPDEMVAELMAAGMMAAGVEEGL